MRRQEELVQAARKEYPEWEEAQCHFIDGARWADAHNEGLNMHIKYLKEELIDKACEWLTRELCYTARNNNFLNNKVATDEFVGLFKNAMKGGNQ